MPDLSPDLLDEIRETGESLIRKFTPPEYIPGCAVKDITDKDQYDTDNGWIECLVSQHNQQRCRWRGQYAGVAVDDVVDVLYFKSYKLFVVYGQGGVAAVKGNAGGYPLSSQILVIGSSGITTYTDLSDAITGASTGNVLVIGQGTFSETSQTINKNLTLIGQGTGATTLSFGAATGLTVSGSTIVNIRHLKISNSRLGDVDTLVVDSGATCNLHDVEVRGNRTTSGAATVRGLYIGTTSGSTVTASDSTLIGFNGTTASYGVYVDNNSSNTLSLTGCHADNATIFTGDAINIQNGTVDIKGTTVDGGITVAGGTVTGYVYDEDEGTVIVLNDGGLHLEERASDPSTPPTGQWVLYFKAGGLYHIDDAGTVTGPIT